MPRNGSDRTGIEGRKAMERMSFLKNARLVYDRDHADFVVKIEPHLFVVGEPGPKSRRSASTTTPGKPRGGPNGERGFRRRSR
jgi:hypothetical protein